MTLLQELQPYFSAAAALLGFATLGFVIRLAAMAQSAERARGAITEERLKLSQDHLSFSEARSKKIEEDLTSENERLRTELETILKTHGLTSENLAKGASLNDVAEVVRNTVQALLKKMESAEVLVGGIKNAAWHLELARGYMASKEWLQAAKQYDQYVIFHPEDFMSQHSRGVAHANTRSGEASYLLALRAYNEAIAFMPGSLPSDTKARFFGHRGAMLKRLNRLLEAEHDLRIATQLSTKKGYTFFDVRYNLACVFAMRGDREKMMEYIDQLEGRYRELSLIRSHLNDYFGDFRNDPAFLKKIEKSSA